MRMLIIGPMRGIPRNNIPAFEQAAAYWQARGWPTRWLGSDPRARAILEQEHITDEDAHYCTRVALTNLLWATAVTELQELPGAVVSQGTVVERIVAGMLGLDHVDRGAA